MQFLLTFTYSKFRYYDDAKKEKCASLTYSFMLLNYREIMLMICNVNTLYSIQYILYTTQSTLYTTQSALYTLHSIQYTLYTTQSTLYALYRIHYTILYDVYCMCIVYNSVWCITR